jgi:hypothetical protein
MGAGDVLFADGDLTYDLFIVLASEVRLLERHGHRECRYRPAPRRHRQPQCGSSHS